jgi:hypothetical protein
MGLVSLRFDEEVAYVDLPAALISGPFAPGLPEAD